MRNKKSAIDVVRGRRVVEPMKLYEYYSWDGNTRNVLETYRVWFSSPGDFNDPFDCLPSIDPESLRGVRFALTVKKIMRRQFPGLSAQEKSRLTRQFRHIGRASVRDKVAWGSREAINSNVGVFCASADPKNILMWSHYAHKHTGICVELDVAPGSDALGFLRLEYASERPLVAAGPDDAAADLVLLTTKPDVWGYEKEWRIVDATGGSGLRHLPAGSITGVRLGCEMSEATRRHVFAVVARMEQRPKVLQALVSKEHYALDFEPMSD